VETCRRGQRGRRRVRGTITTAHLALALLVAVRSAWAAELAFNGPAGEIQGLYLDGDEVPVTTSIVVPLKGWRSIGRQQSWSVRDVKLVESASSRRWTGKLLAGGESFAFEQLEREEGARLRLTVSVASESDAAVEGVYIFVDFPVSDFARGRCSLESSGAPVVGAELPESRPSARHLLAADADTIRVTSADASRAVTVRLARALPVVVQDNREWNTQTYSVFARFHGGEFPRGARASLELSLEASGRADRSPAVVGIEPGRELGRFVGFGGNYCFGIESPVTDYTLAHLRVGCARVEMTLSEWEPQNDNASPSETNWQYLRAQVRPGSNLEREFLLAQRIHRMKIPYGISAWRMPAWLHPRAGAPLERARYAEMVESVSSYLVHARDAYGAEPDWFSFNEPDWGVDVKLSPEDHRDLVKLLGARFAELGLRTKLLLADVTNARGTHTYAAPTVADPEAMRYVNAIGFHSWGGASPAEYGAWAELAARLRLPLYVTEVGVDAQAWRSPGYIETFRYALSEVRHYQELVLHARPTGTMFWEFTSDYGIARETGGRVQPTKRFWFMKHFCDLTPPAAKIIAASSDNERVLATAFVGEKGELAIHVFNGGASRQATVRGLPASARTLHATRTGVQDDYAPLGALAVRGGSVRLELARQSLTTLTSFVPPR